MTTREFLEMYKSAGSQIEAMNDRILMLRSKAEKITPPYDENTGGSNPNINCDKIPVMVEAIMQEEKKMDEYIRESVRLRADIVESIFSVKNTVLSTLLIEKYLNGKTWEQISDTLGFSRYHVEHRLHQEALDAVIIPEKYL